MKRVTTKIETRKGLALLSLGVVVSIIILGLASITPSALLQAIAVLASMVILFFSTHALGHYIAAEVMSVRVKYFFLGRSDFRRLSNPQLSKVGELVPTIGTKLDPAALRSLSRARRALIFGFGAILSLVLLAVELAYVALSLRFALPAIVLGEILLLAILATEFLFGTKAGDFAKMKKA
jgi:hypothetical protein